MASLLNVSTCTRCGVTGHRAAECSRPFFRPHCAFCNRMGHSISECWAQQRTEKDLAKQQTRNAQQEHERAARHAADELERSVLRIERTLAREVRLASRICFRCGEAGHVRADCVKQLLPNTVNREGARAKEFDEQSDSTAATSAERSVLRVERPPRKGYRFDAAVAAAAAAAATAKSTSAAAVRSSPGTDGKNKLRFGPAAFAPIRPGAPPASMDARESLRSSVSAMVTASVPGAAQMRGQRDEMFVTDMLAKCYDDGLFMHGPPSSPLNSLIIPAIRHIFAEMNKLSPSHPKRVDCLSTLALACQDCQQVQAREILRIFGDLTAQNATLVGQLQYSLVRLKEDALNRYISKHHPKCDLGHTEVPPEKQRVHLMSAYVDLIGEAFGLDGVTAARSDRFLPQAKAEIGKPVAATLIKQLQQELSVGEWLLMLLADINNQADTVDRLIDLDSIFKWSQAHMSAQAAYLVFYDEDRAEEFKDQEPSQPTKANRFKPFLSRRVLIDILRAAGMLV